LFIVSAAGGFFGISLCSCCTYVYITHFDFGFVLQKRLKATEVTENTEELYIGEMYDIRPVYLWEAGVDGRGGEKTEDRRQAGIGVSGDQVGGDRESRGPGNCGIWGQGAIRECKD
jgi:hypothetical protein